MTQGIVTEPEVSKQSKPGLIGSGKPGEIDTMQNHRVSLPWYLWSTPLSLQTCFLNSLNCLHIEHHDHPQMAKQISFLGLQFHILRKRIRLAQLELGGFNQLRAGWWYSLRFISSADMGSSFQRKSMLIRKHLKLAY